MVLNFPIFPLFIAGWDKLFKVYSASSWACCELMVLIIPFPIVSDPNPWGKGFLVTQKPVLPHQIISLKNMGEQNYFLLFFGLFLSFMEWFSSNKVGTQTFSSQVGNFCFTAWPLSAPKDMLAEPTRHCPFQLGGHSPLWGCSDRRWKIWNTVIALLLSSLGRPWGFRPHLWLPCGPWQQGVQLCPSAVPSPPCPWLLQGLCHVHRAKHDTGFTTESRPHFQLAPSLGVHRPSEQLRPSLDWPSPLSSPSYVTHTTFSAIQISNLRAF